MRQAGVWCVLVMTVAVFAGSAAWAQPQTPARERLLGRLVQHPSEAAAVADELLRHLPEGLSPEDRDELLDAAAQRLINAGDLSGAERALAPVSAVPPEARDLAWTERAATLVEVRRRRGDIAGALSLQQEIVRISAVFLGADSPALIEPLRVQRALLAQASDPDVARIDARLEVLDRLNEAQRDRLMALGPPSRPAAAPGRQVTNLYRVYYATRRRPLAPGEARVGGDAWFGAATGPLVYGSADVRVPERPNVASALQNVSVWGLELAPSRLRGAAMSAPVAYPNSAAFHSAVSAQAQRGHEILIFVHGYNTTFGGAVRTAAALAMDLDITGPPVVFTWPSRGQLLAYGTDSKLVDDDGVGLSANLADLIIGLARRNPDARIYLVAHSMGNRLALKALGRVAKSAPDVRLAETVLASPDVPAAQFAKQIPQGAKAGARTTVYSSTRDGALLVSRLLNQAPRAGAPGQLPAGLGIDRVDTSRAPTLVTSMEADLLGHDDYLRAALTDLRGLLWRDHPPSRRCYMHAGQGGYYEFGAGKCDIAEYAAAILYMRKFGARARAHAEEDADAAPNSTMAASWQRVAALIDDLAPAKPK